MDTLTFLVFTLVMGAPRTRGTYYDDGEQWLARAWHREADRRGWVKPGLYELQHFNWS